MEVGIKHDEHAGIDFEEDEEHFIYCAEGATVTVDILAKFTTGEDCDECIHGPRTWTWSISGGAPSNYINSSGPGGGGQVATVTLGDAGDTITITCTVGSASEGACEEDRHGDPGEHGGTHAGATASCTIKLWRLDMEVSAPAGDVEQDPQALFSYDTTFAGNVVTQATLVGASSAASTPGYPDWKWESWFNSQLINVMEGSASWGGILVGATWIEVRAKVVNGCDPLLSEFAERFVFVYPTKRRPGWEMSISHGGELDWYGAEDTNQFPTTDPIFKAWAQNTNMNPKYREYNQTTVTPVYAILPGDHPHDIAMFDEKIDEISSGPNLGLWYNTDSSLYTCARVSRINYWIKPSSVKPSGLPASSPYGGSYDSWSGIYTDTSIMFDVCGCSDPHAHDGVGDDIRYRSNVWHEGYGCPSSSNQFRLGHQILMENAVNNGPSAQYDAVWRCDLMHAESKAELQTYDEFARASVSKAIKDESLELEKQVDEDPERHNFWGVMHLRNGSGWESVTNLY